MSARNQPVEPVKTLEKSAKPMTFALIEQAIRSASSQKMDAFELKNKMPHHPGASEFSQVMSEVMDQPRESKPGLARQHVADTLPVPAILGAAFGGDLLKAVHLGPHLNVITAETAAPDDQSLLAFARSQGLDESAVQWLMGTTQGLSSSDHDLPKAGVAIQSGAGLPGPVSPQHPDNHMPIPNGTLNTAALWVMAQQTEPARSTAAAPDDLSQAIKMPIHFMVGAAPATIWMLRNNQTITQDKATLSTRSLIAESELDLTQMASPQLMESLSQALAEAGMSGSGRTPTPLSGHDTLPTAHRLEAPTAVRQEAQNSTASAPPQDDGLGQRNPKLQSLAEKMGQAIGQRILSEIEKGQWHLKLSLRPATLGHIEVEMRMRSGELDALFTAPQAMTRELLQDGMAKLRDTLNQMGMDVASMQVGDGQSQKGGGESTPEKMSKKTGSGVNDSATTPASATRSPIMKMGQDGWDVLV
jgi:flagellar hook-length control protein FliK